MKKILFIHHASTWGGAPNSMIKLIENLDKEKYEAEVLLMKTSVVSERLKNKGIKYSIAKSVFYNKFYHYFPHIEFEYLKWFQILKFTKLALYWFLSRYYFAKRELDRHEFDIVHLNASVLTDWMAPAKKSGKVVIHIREPLRKGSFNAINIFLLNQMRRYADHIIAISNENANRINIPHKTSVVYNYSNIENLNELEIGKYSSHSILYVGGSERSKGFQNMVDALQFINKGIIVYFAGYYSMVLSENKNDISSKIKRIIKKMLFRKEAELFQKIQNSQKAMIVGLIPEINAYLDKSVCLVSPFTIPHFSRPIIEAFARRKPAIATNIDGMNEMIEDGHNGILIPNGDSKALASAINYLCENPDVAKKMGDNGYDVAKYKFSQNNINQISTIYNNLFQEGN